jgi:hypothetical protein
LTDVERKEVGELGREMVEFVNELRVLLMKSTKGVDRWLINALVTEHVLG